MYVIEFIQSISKPNAKLFETAEYIFETKYFWQIYTKKCYMMGINIFAPYCSNDLFVNGSIFAKLLSVSENAVQSICYFMVLTPDMPPFFSPLQE